MRGVVAPEKGGVSWTAYSRYGLRVMGAKQTRPDGGDGAREGDRGGLALVILVLLAFLAAALLFFGSGWLQVDM